MRIRDSSSEVITSDFAKFQFDLLTVALAPETVGGTKAAFQIARDRKETPARLGQPDLAAITNEQRRANEFFEFGDPGRQRRLGYADAQRGLREAARVDHGEKLADVRALYHKFFLCQISPGFNFHMRKF